MYVGHGDGIADDPRQRGGVDQLLDTLVSQRLFEQFTTSIDARGDAHVLAITLGNFPDIFI